MRMAIYIWIELRGGYFTIAAYCLECGGIWSLQYQVSEENSLRLALLLALLFQIQRSNEGWGTSQPT